MDSIAKEFEQRKDERPDQWTLAWWREELRDVMKGYRGATHAVHLAIAELCDARDEAAKFKSQCEQLQRQLDESKAKIGHLSARVDLANVTLCDAREQIEALAAKCAAMERQADESRAKTGELSARVDKIAAFANELKAEREAKKGKAT